VPVQTQQAWLAVRQAFLEARQASAQGQQSGLAGQAKSQTAARLVAWLAARVQRAWRAAMAHRQPLRREPLRQIEVLGYLEPEAATTLRQAQTATQPERMQDRLTAAVMPHHHQAINGGLQAARHVETLSVVRVPSAQPCQHGSR
jgi:D-alanyl-D-alanine dipeptidase